MVDQRLVDWIIEQRRNGHTEGEIFTCLSQKKYPLDVITESMAAASRGAAPAATREYGSVLKMGVGVVVLFIAISAFFWMISPDDEPQISAEEANKVDTVVWSDPRQVQAADGMGSDASQPQVRESAKEAIPQTVATSTVPEVLMIKPAQPESPEPNSSAAQSVLRQDTQAQQPALGGDLSPGMVITNAPAPQQPADINVITVAQGAPEPAITEDCARYGDMLFSCTPHRCRFSNPLTNEYLVRSIIGLTEGRCVTLDEMPNRGKMECSFTDAMRAAASQYFKDIETAGSIGMLAAITSGGRTGVNYTIDGKQVENPMQEALSQGQCIMSGY